MTDPIPHPRSENFNFKFHISDLTEQTGSFVPRIRHHHQTRLVLVQRFSERDSIQYDELQLASGWKHCWALPAGYDGRGFVRAQVRRQGR